MALDLEKRGLLFKELCLLKIIHYQNYENYSFGIELGIIWTKELDVL